MSNKKLKHRSKSLLITLMAAALLAASVLTGTQIVNAEESVAATSSDGTQTYRSTTDAWNAALKGTKIVLQSNWSLSSRLVVSSGSNVTIEMNGHTISRNLKDYESNGEVIEMEDDASLTLLGNDNPNKSSNIRCVDFDREDIDGESNYKFMWLTSGGFINGGLSTNGAGGIHMHENSSLTLDNVAVAGNFTKSSIFYSDNGGGIKMAGDNCKLTMKNNAYVDYNYAYDYGGGVYIDGDYCKITMENGCHINNNRADKQGGGVYMNQENITISGGAISGNKAKNGGGIYNNDSNNTVSDCKITKNTASESGGGLYCDSLKDISLTGIVYILDNKRGDATDDDLYLQTGAASQAYLVSAPAEKSAIGIRLEEGNIPDSGLQVAKNQTTYNEGMFFSNLSSFYVFHRYSDKTLFLKKGTTEKSYYVVINGERYKSYKEGETAGTNGKKNGELFWKWIAADGISLSDLKSQYSSLTTFKMPANSVFLTAGYVTPVDKLTLTVDMPKGGEKLDTKATLSWIDDDNKVQEKDIAITWYEINSRGETAASENAKNKCKYYFKADIREGTTAYLKLSEKLNEESVTVVFEGDDSKSTTANSATLSNGVLSVVSKSQEAEYGKITISDVVLNVDTPTSGLQLPTKATLSWNADRTTKTADVFVHWYVDINGEENLASLGKADYDTTYTPELCIYASQQEDLSFDYDATVENVTLTYGDSDENQIQSVYKNSAGNIVIKGKPVTTSKPEVTRVPGGSITVQSGTSIEELENHLPKTVLAYIGTLTGEKATSLPLNIDDGDYDSVAYEYEGIITSSGNVDIPLNITSDSEVAMPDTDDTTCIYTLQVNVTEKQDLPQAEVPAIDKNSGTYKQTSLTVNASCGTENAVIKYKVDDGAEQTYDSETGIVLSGKEMAQTTHTLTVWAEAEGFSKSNEIIANYILDDLRSDSSSDYAQVITVYYKDSSEKDSNWKEAKSYICRHGSQISILVPDVDGLIFDKWVNLPDGVTESKADDSILNIENVQDNIDLYAIYNSAEETPEDPSQKTTDGDDKDQTQEPTSASPENNQSTADLKNAANKANSKDVVKTGDENNMIIWMMMLIAGCGVVAGAVVVSRKKDN